MVKSESYYVIHGWMINDLHLKGLELNVYAIIYGFSQTENQFFSGSRQYLADFTNTTVRGVQKALNSLVEQQLLEKFEQSENNQIYYRAVLNSNIPVNRVPTPVNRVPTPVNRVPTPVNRVPTPVNIVPTPREQSSPTTIYNIEYIIEDNIVDSIATQSTIAEYKADDCKQAEQKPQKKKESKRAYGEYQHVKLTDKQYDSLVHDYGENRIQEYITKMDSWIQMKGKSPYKDFNLAIRQWISRDGISKLGDSKSQNDVYDEYEKNQDLPF